jgi:hypothetical protein
MHCHPRRQACHEQRDLNLQLCRCRVRTHDGNHDVKEHVRNRHHDDRIADEAYYHVAVGELCELERRDDDVVERVFCFIANPAVRSMLIA